MAQVTQTMDAKSLNLMYWLKANVGTMESTLGVKIDHIALEYDRKTDTVSISYTPAESAPVTAQTTASAQQNVSAPPTASV